MHKALRRALVSLGAVPAAALATVALAIPAGAATTGAPVYSPDEAGYTATNNTFRFVKADFPLPDPTQYAASLKRIEFVSEFWSKSRVTMLGVYAATNSTTYHLEAAVFNPRTKSLICATWSAKKRCSGTSASWNTTTYPAGDTAELSSYFSQGAGTMHWVAQDLQTKTLLTLNHKGLGTAPMTEGRLGAEFGCTPWTACGGASKVSYKAPPSPPQKLIEVDDCEITTTAGPRTGFGGKMTHHSLTMTSNGKSTGKVLIGVTKLIKGHADNPLGQFNIVLK